MMKWQISQANNKRNLLSLEGLVLGLVEVPRHDFLAESLGIEHLEGLAAGQPAHDVRKVHGDRVAQHGVQLHGKGGGGAVAVVGRRRRGSVHAAAQGRHLVREEGRWLDLLLFLRHDGKGGGVAWMLIL